MQNSYIYDEFTPSKACNRCTTRQSSRCTLSFAGAPLSADPSRCNKRQRSRSPETSQEALLQEPCINSRDPGRQGWAILHAIVTRLHYRIRLVVARICTKREPLIPLPTAAPTGTLREAVAPANKPCGQHHSCSVRESDATKRIWARPSSTSAASLSVIAKQEL